MPAISSASRNAIRRRGGIPIDTFHKQGGDHNAHMLNASKPAPPSGKDNRNKKRKGRKGQSNHSRHARGGPVRPSRGALGGDSKVQKMGDPFSSLTYDDVWAVFEENDFQVTPKLIKVWTQFLHERFPPQMQAMLG